MQEPAVDTELLWAFEQGLDPRLPEKSQVPAKVLGYGEISTVFEIGNDSQRSLVYKRMPMFTTETEARHFEELYTEYVGILRRIGIQVVPNTIYRMADPGKDKVVVYIVQEKLPKGTIGDQLIRTAAPDDARKLMLSVLQEIKKVFDFNRENEERLEVGFDGQISNWAALGFDSVTAGNGAKADLIYFDTGGPLLRKNGQEQLDPELYLRAAPSFLVWILRMLYVKDIVNRYYDLRQVAVDLVANVYKEQRADLISGLVNTVNEFFAAEIQADVFKPLTVDEVNAYYKQDARIWRIYMAFRKMDRFLHGLIGQKYPYSLPERISR